MIREAEIFMAELTSLEVCAYTLKRYKFDGNMLWLPYNFFVT